MLHADFDSSLGNTPRGKGITVHFSVVDADVCHAALLARGLKPEHEPQDRPWGREFSIRDPDGYEIEFIGPRKSDD